MQGWLGGVLQALRQVALTFRDNWGLALLSLVLAISLWIFVTDRDDPERTARFSSAIPVECVNVPLGKAVAPSCSETKSVTVRVRAPESVFDRLTADDFRASADLSEVMTDEATVTVRVESTEPRVEIVDVTPNQITVGLENVTSRTVPVRTRLVGTPPRGFEAEEMTLDPEEAIVTGPESLVGRVAAVETDVNLTNRRTAFDETLLLQARDELGGNIQGVNVDPESVSVHGEIRQLEISAAVIVRPNVQGLPADGFSVTAIQTDPPFVFVTGPAEVVQSIDLIGGVTTAAVSIDGSSVDVVRPVVLQLPQGVTVNQPRVTVRVVIAPTQSAFTYNVGLTAVNVPDGLTAALDQAVVRITVSGLLTVLAGIDAGSLAAMVDLDGLAAGVHVLPVEVQAPSGVSIDAYTPIETAVTLSLP